MYQLFFVWFSEDGKRLRIDKSPDQLDQPVHPLYTFWNRRTKRLASLSSHILPYLFHIPFQTPLHKAHSGHEYKCRHRAQGRSVKECKETGTKCDGEPDEEAEACNTVLDQFEFLHCSFDGDGLGRREGMVEDVGALGSGLLAVKVYTDNQQVWRVGGAHKRRRDSPLGSASLTMISAPVMGSRTRRWPFSAFAKRSVGLTGRGKGERLVPYGKQLTLVGIHLFHHAGLFIRSRGSIRLVSLLALLHFGGIRLLVGTGIDGRATRLGIWTSALGCSMAVASDAAAALPGTTLPLLGLPRTPLDHLGVGVGLFLVFLLGGLVALDGGHGVVRGVSLPDHVGGRCGGQVREVCALAVCAGGWHWGCGWARWAAGSAIYEGRLRAGEL